MSDPHIYVGVSLWKLEKLCNDKMPFSKTNFHSPNKKLRPGVPSLIMTYELLV